MAKKFLFIFICAVLGFSFQKGFVDSADNDRGYAQSQFKKSKKELRGRVINAFKQIRKEKKKRSDEAIAGGIMLAIGIVVLVIALSVEMSGCLAVGLILLAAGMMGTGIGFMSG